MSRLVRLLGVSLGVAVAAWLLPASVHIVDWPASGPVRVALLAPLWRLWVAIAATSTVTGLAAAYVLRVSRRRHTTTASDTALAASPLALMWLWAIPYLPWLPDRAPVLLALGGPLRWGIVVLALGGSLRAALRPGTVLAAPGALAGASALAGRRTIFAVSLALYLSFGLWSAAEVGPDADEPHYLVITQSLLRDHDLAIENNHARLDYREYYGGELRPDFLRRGLNEVIYSIHAPGLPALLVPAYAAAGYRGAVAMLCLLGALAALAVFDLAMLVAGPRAAWFTWAAVCLTVPFVPHSWLIFPEMPGALIVAWSTLWVCQPLPTRARTWIWRGLALGALPWLHTKLVILLAAMAAALCVRVWRSPKAVAALAAPVVVSLGLWIDMFHRLYGVFDPQVPYGDFPKHYVLFANIPRGVLGLLFDQKFGVLAYSPVYLVAIAGGWIMLRRPESRRLAIMLLLVTGAFVASSTRMYMWWGGSSAPARFLVPILPLVAPMMAVAFRDLRSPAARAASGLLLGISLAIATIGVIEPRRFLLFSAPHGFANMVDAAQGGSPLSYALPTFTEEGLGSSLERLAPWAAAALLALAVGLAASRLKGRLAGFWAASAGLVAFAVGGAVFAGAPALASERRATATRGRLAFMRAFDGSSLRGLDYSRRVRLNARGLLDLATLSFSRSSGALSDDPRQLAGPIRLPAGRYIARLTLGGAARRDGRAGVMLGDGIPIARSDGPLTSGTTLAFGLPVDAPVWVTVSDEAIAQSVQQVDVVAESIVPKGQRPDLDVRAIEAIEARPGAFIVYADGETYPEGGVFWTRGTHAGTVWVSPGGASMLVLTLHVGPIGGVAHVRVGGQDHPVTMAHDETQRIEVPLAPSDRLVPVVVEAPGRFQPAEHEPGSTDRRWLGCQVRIGLR